MSKAKELCPNLLVLHYDFKQYEIVAEKVQTIYFFLFVF